MDNKLTIKTYLQFISIKNYFHAQFFFQKKKSSTATMIFLIVIKQHILMIVYSI